MSTTDQHKLDRILEDDSEHENEPVRLTQVNSGAPPLCEIPVADFGTQIWVKYWRVNQNCL